MASQHRPRCLKREQTVDSSPVRLNCYPLSRLDMNGMKSLRSVLEVKTDRIYNAVSAGQRLRD